MQSSTILTRPLESALQRAERKANSTPLGRPPSGPVAPEAFPAPPAATVLAQYHVNGGSISQAVHNCNLEAKAGLARMKLIAPSQFAQAETARASSNELAEKLHRIIDTARGNIGDTTTALLSMGEARRRSLKNIKTEAMSAVGCIQFLIFLLPCQRRINYLASFIVVAAKPRQHRNSLNLRGA